MNSGYMDKAGLCRAIRAFITFCTALFLLAGLSSCSSIESETPSETPTTVPTESREATPTPIPAPAAGGELVLSMRPAITLNPILNKDETVDKILGLIFEPLALYDSSFRIVPNEKICKSIDMSFDGLSLVVRLSSDAYWSDGEKITSADLIYTFDTLSKADDDVIYKENMSNIDSYMKIDDENVRITFSKPIAFAAGCLRLPIIPKHYYSAGIPARELAPLGNGAYIFSSLSSVREMRLKASDNAAKPAYITDIKVLITPEASDLDSFRSGITDLCEMSVIEFGNIGANRNAYEFESTQLEFIGFNLRSETWGMETNRKAVAHCISKADVLEGIYLNRAVTAETPIHPNSWVYTDDVKRYEFNLETAKSLYLGGTETTILINEGNRERLEIAKMLKRNLLRIGVEAEIISLPYEEYVQSIEIGDYEIIVSGFNLSADNKLSWILHSGDETGNGNILGYSDPLMNSLLLAAETSVGDFSAKQAYADLQKRIADELPFISLVFRKDALITDKKLYGVVPSYGCIFGNVNEWYIWK